DAHLVLHALGEALEGIRLAGRRPGVLRFQELDVVEDLVQLVFGERVELPEHSLPGDVLHPDPSFRRRILRHLRGSYAAGFGAGSAGHVDCRARMAPMTRSPAYEHRSAHCPLPYHVPGACLRLTRSASTR